MSPRSLIVVAMALICGTLAAIGVKAMSKQQPVGPAAETLPVVVTSVDIQRGETIREAMLEIRQVPKEQVPPGALTQLTEVTERTAHYPMLKGDVVAEAKLSPKGSGSGMASLIRPGMRAFTIQTPSLSSSMAGFLLPGNRVDVLLTMTTPTSPDDDAGGPTTTTLLQNIEVLAVHTTVDTPSTNRIDPDQARSITLLVTPAQASLLDLGQNKGTLHLSLRNLKDAGEDKPDPSTMANLQLPRPPRPKPPEVVVVAPPPEPPKPIEPPKDPDPLPIRTLRGTQSGNDWLKYRPGPPAAVGQGLRLSERSNESN